MAPAEITQSSQDIYGTEDDEEMDMILDALDRASKRMTAPVPLAQ